MKGFADGLTHASKSLKLGGWMRIYMHCMREVITSSPAHRAGVSDAGSHYLQYVSVLDVLHQWVDEQAETSCLIYFAEWKVVTIRSSRGFRGGRSARMHEAACSSHEPMDCNTACSQFQVLEFVEVDGERRGH